MTTGICSRCSRSRVRRPGSTGTWLLRKRAGYKAAFHDFDLRRVAAMTDSDLEALREDAGIVRNRLKIYSTRGNARAILDIQDEQGSFDAYL